jgi:hypothetical protein
MLRIFSILILLPLFTLNSFCQVENNVTVRICIGDFPGQKKIPGGDYRPTICAYAYDNTKPVLFEVVSFDLIYVNPDGSKEVATGKGNELTPIMKAWLTKSDSTTINYFFIGNVVLLDKKKREIKVKHLMPAVLKY